MGGSNDILTISGVFIDPFDAKPDQINVYDIAHALSLICRANGHIDHFYSVAQHCLNCVKEARARGFSKKIQLYCLLHDAAECYISDITRPVKNRLELYKESEEKLLNIIYKTLCESIPTEEECSQIGIVDDCLLHHEFLILRGVKIFDEEPCLYSKCSFENYDIINVRESYINLYRELADK